MESSWSWFHPAHWWRTGGSRSNSTQKARARDTSSSRSSVDIHMISTWWLLVQTHVAMWISCGRWNFEEYESRCSRRMVSFEKCGAQSESETNLQHPAAVKELFIQLNSLSKTMFNIDLNILKTISNDVSKPYTLQLILWVKSRTPLHRPQGGSRWPHLCVESALPRATQTLGPGTLSMARQWGLRNPLWIFMGVYTFEYVAYAKWKMKMSR